MDAFLSVTIPVLVSILGTMYFVEMDKRAKIQAHKEMMLECLKKNTVQECKEHLPRQ